MLAASAPVVFAYNGGIGDRLCNLPALRALAAIFAGRLSLVCARNDKASYYSDLDLSAVHEIDLELADGGFTFDAEALAGRIGRCDLFLCINPWHSVSVTRLLARLPSAATVGFFAEFGHCLPCDCVGHAIDMSFAVPAALDRRLRPEDFSQPPAISASAAAMARQFTRRHAGFHRTLFVHTDTKPEKSWPREQFARLLESFLGEFPDFKALVVDLRGEWVGCASPSDRLVPVNLPLDASFALLRDSDLFLGIDSCHLHAADLFGVPGVGLFGPTTARRWGYRFTRHRHLQADGEVSAIGRTDVFTALCGLARAPGRRSDESRQARA